ncbi:solute carrier family 22 member 13-like isoform X1 [Biomphalaria pfeifferi]|uniref:Solute carrier family 22 member 13-like isoform X1 n=1 Tax=Biomphalaria pfeifferi TaxID=112525 RepID=A0AAD8BUJ9_BIOPF|nr:solute carrier family 22 member 13-like isoform X1 [Biomphalaria pfeifferi]
MMSLDDIFHEIGGLNRFQLLIILCVYGLKIPSAWSMIQITFAGLVPPFLCNPNTNLSVETSSSNESFNSLSNMMKKKPNLNVCSLNGTSCQDFTFLGDVRTIISEWNLVCDMKWTKATITTIQMAGVLLGAMLAGQFGDYFGRKKTTYSFFLAHLLFNCVTYFSPNWQIFGALRFCIGATIGANLVMTVPYCSEYLPLRWRTLIPIIPMWPIGTAIFAGVAFLLPNWRYLHLANAALSAPFLLGYFCVPESVRWLATKGRMSEAFSVIEKIAALNRKPVPAYTMDVIEAVAAAEEKSRKAGHKYNYLDLFRGKTMVITTLVLGLHWIVLSLVFYGLSFGASSFTGNVYLNIFIIGIIDIPGNITVIYWSNRFGRKKSTIGFLLIGSLASFGCLATIFAAEEVNKGSILRGLSLAAKLGIAGSWVSVQTWVGELYPTVTRSLAYGFVNTASRVGGMLAPFAINLDDWIVFSFSLMGCISLVTGLLLTLIPETLNQTLRDSANTADASMQARPNVVINQIFTFSNKVPLDNGHSQKSAANECPQDSSKLYFNQNNNLDLKDNNSGDYSDIKQKFSNTGL